MEDNENIEDSYIAQTAQGLFAVIPLNDCPHLQELHTSNPSVFESLGEDFDISAPCDICNDSTENWMCVTCHKVLCGRFINSHMLEHGQTFNHALTISLSDISCWCYGCQSYIHNIILTPVKNSIHYKKFGVEIPIQSV
ncbi:unnamed protein product [Gordionus sp. m RMFG-2023]|uniref:histone deacetylase 6-like n=1 Tax=Gordionus sp. m RMFG-2023 TaxID=3053472 RepID=UPI0030E15467